MNALEELFLSQSEKCGNGVSAITRGGPICLPKSRFNKLHFVADYTYLASSCLTWKAAKADISREKMGNGILSGFKVIRGYRTCHRSKRHCALRWAVKRQQSKRIKSKTMCVENGSNVRGAIPWDDTRKNCNQHRDLQMVQRHTQVRFRFPHSV